MEFTIKCTKEVLPEFSGNNPLKTAALFTFKKQNDVFTGEYYVEAYTDAGDDKAIIEYSFSQQIPSYHQLSDLNLMHARNTLFGECNKRLLQAYNARALTYFELDSKVWESALKKLETEGEAKV